MPRAVGVAFKRVAKSYWFDPAGIELADMDRVIVDTARGPELGTVRVTEREVPMEDLQGPLKRVIRKATDADLEQEERNKERAANAVRVAKERVAHHGLPMRVLTADYVFDASQVTISFAAEGRVDFRELVRDLAGLLRCRVQLYQVGARDQAKIIGGVGPCGLTLCCSTFLTEFAPISMKMAKDQSLFVNPVKFSGVCGKLMCCLRYEHEAYVDAKSRLPSAGDTVRTPAGKGRVVEVHVIREEVAVQLEGSEATVRFPAADVSVERKGRCGSCGGCSLLGDSSYGDAQPEELNLRDLEG